MIAVIFYSSNPDQERTKHKCELPGDPCLWDWHSFLEQPERNIAQEDL